MRGTSPERYIRYPSSSPLTPGTRLGPRMNVQPRTATRAWPTGTKAGSAPLFWRKVTTARRLTTPITMTAASNIRAVTKPSAMPSFCRLTTGNSATAVPTAETALTRSRKQPKMTVESAPGPVM